MNMQVVYCIAGLICLAGLGLMGLGLGRVLIWLFARRMEATIMDVSGQAGKNRRIRFCYEYIWQGTVMQSWGPWYESWNPALILFPSLRIGGRAVIRVRRKNGTIAWPLIPAVLYAFLGGMIAVCGASIFLML